MNLSRRVPGQLLKGAGLGQARPEAFVEPFVVRISGDPDGARLLDDRLARDFGQHVRHWQLQLVAHLAEKTLPARMGHDGDQLLDELKLLRHALVSLRIGLQSSRVG